MATKKSKKKENAAFLAKIKTITVGTGAKSSAPKCPDCGESMQGYLAIPVIAIPIHGAPPEAKPEAQPAVKSNDEVAFSA